MRSHGSARACYKGQCPPTGSCERCRKANAELQRTTNRRFAKTAKGMLRVARVAAARRKA